MASPFRHLPPAATCTPTPFVASVPEEQLKELRHLIEQGKIGPSTFENQQPRNRYGITPEWLRHAQDSWLKFDCSPTAVPILMMHGWPGSFLEFLPILRILTQKYTPSTLPYHIIVPSLPGYGFSSPAPTNVDFRLEDACDILESLMIQLGFGSGFAVQGGDVGSKLSRIFGGVHPRCKIVHLNFCLMPDPGNTVETKLSDAERAGLQRTREFQRIGSAYAIEHATRPATISLVLSSSPIALLAWVGEKFLEWTDEDLPLDTILAEVTLYWLTNCISNAFYPYRQLFTPGEGEGAHENPKWYIDKPLGFSWFPKEATPVPRAWIETTGRLVWFRQHDKGGHFAALERPEALLQDLEEFIGKFWERGH